jgi:fatty acid desaturase
MHREHHYYAGYLEKDPTAMSFVRWRETGRIPLIVRFAWRSWVPLVAAVQHVVFWIYPLKLARAGEKKKLHESLASILFLIVAYTAVGWLAATRLESFNILPALVLYLAMNELVNLPHHTVLPSFDRPLRLWEQWQVSRSGYYPRIVSEVLMLNFNFHTEHHLYPTLPWFRLRACRNLVVDVLGDAYNEADGPSWNVTHRGRDFREIARATGDPAVLSPHVATAD